MDNFGLELRQARERLGVSLRDIAARTKISVAALDALERNDFSRLPGGIFGRAFVRSYAIEIGLDPETTVATFVALLEESEREAAARGAVRPEITDDDRRFLERQRRAVLGLRVGAVALVVVAAAVVVWQVRVFLQARGTAAPATTDAPARAATLPTPPPAPSVLAASERIVLELDLAADCWISISVDGKSPLAQQFHIGDQQRIEADREISLDAANAGAIRMTINGKAAKPIGRTGVPGRVRLTRDNLATFLE
jgi:cytoskeletal protein RodZ